MKESETMKSFIQDEQALEPQKQHMLKSNPSKYEKAPGDEINLDINRKVSDVSPGADRVTSLQSEINTI